MSHPFLHTLRVRYGECDVHGVVFNAHYLGYFDTSIVALWRSACEGYQAMLDRGVDMVLAEAQLRFLRPAHFDEELELGVALTHLGNTSLRAYHSARCAGELATEGRLRYVFVDRQTAAKRPIPDWLRDSLEPFVAPEAEPATTQ